MHDITSFSCVTSLTSKTLWLSWIPRTGLRRSSVCECMNGWVADTSNSLVLVYIVQVQGCPPDEPWAPSERFNTKFPQLQYRFYFAATTWRRDGKHWQQVLIKIKEKHHNTVNTCEGCGRSIQEAAEWTVHVAVYKWTMTSVDHYKLSSQKNLNIQILIWTAITMATDEAL